MNQYPNDIFIQWHTDSYGSKYSIRRVNESYIVVGNKIALNEIPDRQFRVKITGMEEVDKIEDNNDYKVDYDNGFIYFHSSLDGSTITIATYYGRGLIMYPSSRIWTKLSVDGQVIETLDGAFPILDGQSTAIQSLKGTRISEGTTEPTDTKYWYDPNDNSGVVRT